MKIRTLAALGVLALAGCTVPVPSTVDKADILPPSSASATPSSDAYVADTADWKVTLKVTSKQCFGSAGCNVEANPLLRYVGTAPHPTDGRVTVTFVISGDTSGPITQTTEADLSSGDQPITPVFLSTSGQAVKPKAKVTEVTVNPY